MPTVVLFENDLSVSRTLTVNEEPVAAVAFNDLFKTSELLEDFVRSIANGEVDYPEKAASELLEDMELTQ